ncbi:transposase [Streptomyces ficellus]|uniref:transposase n=1 Tax=Streptomyces ficellus TaxID=1977088 RepID=UPI00338E655D
MTRSGGPPRSCCPGQGGAEDPHPASAEGIIHRLGIGVQWRELPEGFGPWQTARRRGTCCGLPAPMEP